MRGAEEFAGLPEEFTRLEMRPITVTAATMAPTMIMTTDTTVLRDEASTSLRYLPRLRGPHPTSLLG